MKCPYCENDGSRVVETRENHGENVNRRRRECKSCKDRFTTYERVAPPSMTVLKRDGTEQRFDREKLAGGIEKACKKRPISETDIEDLVRGVTTEIRSRGRAQIETAEIGDLVMSRLKELDEVAYIRYASIYNAYDDVASFKEEVETLTTTQTTDEGN